eukprot:2190249-Pyramimonas_sp.AAC.1
MRNKSGTCSSCDEARTGTTLDRDESEISEADRADVEEKVGSKKQKPHEQLLRRSQDRDILGPGQ